MGRHGRRLSIGAFLLGFFLDYLTLTRVDRLFDNLVLLSYLLLVLLGIVVTNAHVTGRIQGLFGKQSVETFRFLLPFSFGGLFSGLLVFYSKSGAILASAPFLLILVGFLVGNELLKKHYERFLFQLTVFYVALFAYTALVLPVLVESIGPSVFIMSGLLSLAFFALTIRVLRFVARDVVERSVRSLVPIVAIVFITFNILYFNGMIPPVPLSLTEAGVYHSVTRLRSGGYGLSYEEPHWWEFGYATAKTYRQSAGEPAYAWSSIYAPTGLSTAIVHRWYRYDEETRKFIDITAIPFVISGGRQEGFRGYSMKQNLTAGRWRVDVETERGQVIGRFFFTVELVSSPPALTQTLR